MKADRSNFPVLIPHPEVVLPKLESGGSLIVGGIWGSVTAGQTVNASDGTRFLWSADALNVVYYQAGKFYSQNSGAFAAEVRTAPLVQAGRASLFMVRLAKMEMKFLSGILAGASGIGFAAVIGTEVAEFVVTNRENFEKWNSQLDSVLKARQFLKTYAPTLYDKVFNAVLRKVLRESFSLEAVSAETVAFGVGVIFGHAGKEMARAAFGMLGLVWLVIKQCATRYVLNILPESVRLTEDEYRKMANDLIAKFREANIELHEGDVRKIVDEVRHHPKEIQKAYEILKQAFDRD